MTKPSSELSKKELFLRVRVSSVGCRKKLQEERDLTKTTITFPVLAMKTTLWDILDTINMLSLQALTIFFVL